MKLINPLSRRLTRSNGNGIRKSTPDRFTVKPAYDLHETPEAWGLTVQLPGVDKESLDVTAEEGQLVVRGRRSWTKPEGWTTLHRESPDADYELVLAHDNLIDTDRIHAELRNGVLRISMPKTEAIKPRKISVG